MIENIGCAQVRFWRANLNIYGTLLSHIGSFVDNIYFIEQCISHDMNAGGPTNPLHVDNHNDPSTNILCFFNCR